MSKIAIIILNWNGYIDTVECLDSLMKNDCSIFDIIVVDNGSTDESLERIRAWFQDRRLTLNNVLTSKIPSTFSEIDTLSHETVQEHGAQTYTLITSDKNLGFSAGNNLGMRFAIRRPYDSVLLLNNDTTLAEDAIKTIHDAMISNPLWGACVPKIKYYDTPDTIWNAGGFLRPLGGRKYLYGDAVDADTYTGTRRITFATGCALAIRVQLVKEFGGLCEDFFFGEEDYELSMRYFKKKILMYTVLDAVVYHKVGISRTKLLDQNTLAGTFTHHLNRLIHMKRYMSTLQWMVWRFGSLVYIFFLLVVKKKVPISRKLVKYFRELIKLSTQHSGVDQSLFLKSKELLK